MIDETKTTSSADYADLLKILKERFLKNMERHKGFSWETIEAKLKTKPEKLNSLYEMERTGGEVDVVAFDENKSEIIFVDCCQETPKGRRSICYDRKGLESRKEHQPLHTAVDMANEMGIEILNEEEYRLLQEFATFDTKTSSWIKTPANFRKCGSAFFCDRRCDTVFVYHSGAQSYYSSRGFRGMLRL